MCVSCYHLGLGFSPPFRVMAARSTPSGANAGERHAPTEPTTAKATYEAVGSGPALRLLHAQPFVMLGEDAVSIRVPVSARGSGEEKVRPSSGTMFNRPTTLSSTARQLAVDHAQRVKAAVKAGEL